MEKLRNNKVKLIDYVMIALLSLIAAIIAFSYLGSRSIPINSFTKDTNSLLNTITIDINDNTVTNLWVYQGIGYSHILITSYDELGGPIVDSQLIYVENGDMYRWEIFPLKEQCGRYIRLTVLTATAEIYELALADDNGKISTLNYVGDVGIIGALFDEQNLIPDNPSLLTDMYFDEIYHARTALEFINGDEVYETTHPPLGKIIISLGIQMFGMNPFGWRFMDALFSVMLIPLFYFFIFLFTRSTAWSTVGTGLFVIDGMRIVMGRIATLDTFAVFFILAAFLFMYLFYININNRKFLKWLIPLALSGIMFGLSAATKWTGIYAGAGLFVVFIISIIKWLINYSKDPARKTNRLITDGHIIIKLSSIIFTCLIFFIAIPSIIYLLSYIPFKAGLNTSDSLFKVMLDNQKFMYSYHSTLTATHPYSSMWYMWLFDAKPVYFYLGEDLLPDGVCAKIFAFGNYLIWVVGFIALIYVIINTVNETLKAYKEKRQLSIEAKEYCSKNICLIIFYLALLVPWIFVTRVAFLYHYYVCIPPLIVITILLLKRHWNDGIILLRKNSRLRKFPIIIENGNMIMGRFITMLFVSASIIIFVICYPLYTGMPVDWVIFSKF